MLTRILTSLVGLVVFFGIIFASPFVLYLALLVVATEMLLEVYRVMDAGRGLTAIGFLTGFIMFAGFFADKVGLAFYAAVFIFMTALVFVWEKNSSKETLATGMATIFITCAILSLAVIRENFGVYAVILPFVIAWLTDTGAYFIGYFFGKHKLVPKMSPKKTIEGAIGGMVFAVISTVVFGALYSGDGATAVYFVKCGIVGAVGSVISQIGDLAASCIKRDFGKKDYGAILPGHGGLMDRFDSVLFAAPFALLALTYFGI